MEAQRAEGVQLRFDSSPLHHLSVNKFSDLSKFTVTPKAVLSDLQGSWRGLSVQTSLPEHLTSWAAGGLDGSLSTWSWPAGLARSGVPRSACRFINGQAEGPEWRARTRPFLKAPASPRAPTGPPHYPGLRESYQGGRVENGDHEKEGLGGMEGVSARRM